MKNYDDRVEEFLATGMTTLPIDLRVQIKLLLHAYFLKILYWPVELREKMLIDLSPNGRPDHGLYRREDAGGDWKTIFHLRPWDTVNHVRDIYKNRGVILPDDFSVWCDNVELIMAKYLYALGKFVEALDQEAGWDFDLAGQLKSHVAMEKHVMRFIHYDPDQPYDDLASKHGDFGFITFAGDESHSGLWLKEKDNLYIPQPGESLIFAGRKIELATDGLVPAVCHGVIKTPDFNPEESRSSVVMFFHGTGEMGPSCPS